MKVGSNLNELNSPANSYFGVKIIKNNRNKKQTQYQFSHLTLHNCAFKPEAFTIREPKALVILNVAYDVPTLTGGFGQGLLQKLKVLLPQAIAIKAGTEKSSDPLVYLDAV